MPCPQPRADTIPAGITWGIFSFLFGQPLFTELTRVRADCLITVQDPDEPQISTEKMLIIPGIELPEWDLIVFFFFFSVQSQEI